MSIGHVIGIALAITAGLIALKLGVDFSNAMQNLSDQLNLGISN